MTENIDILRCLMFTAAFFNIGLSLILFFRRSLFVPHGMRSILAAIVLMAVGAISEVYKRHGAEYTWRTWVYATAFMLMTWGLARFLLHIGYCNPWPQSPSARAITGKAMARDVHGTAKHLTHA